LQRGHSDSVYRFLHLVHLVLGKDWDDPKIQQKIEGIFL